MSKVLVIVESPNKIKKLQPYLGPGYIVKASVGHFRALTSLKDIDIENNYKPKYSIEPKKASVVSDLRRAAKMCNGRVLIATDPDREGEAIGWHIAQILGLDLTKKNRISFREITKKAVLDAVKKPEKLDIALFYAQQGRAVLDLLIGFELSPLVGRYFGRRSGISAGRVQSVVNKLIIDREKEIRKFASNSYYLVKGTFKHKASFNPENEGKKLSKEENVAVILDGLLDHHLTWKSSSKDDGSDDEDNDSNEGQNEGRDNSKNYNSNDGDFDSLQEKTEWYLGLCNVSKFKLKSIERKEGKNRPFPPYTTSTLQQDANRYLGLPAKVCMNYAQKLFEGGHITYHRTDSTTLCEDILAKIKEYVIKKWGQKYQNTRRYKTKSSSAQEAHEAIRPTHIDKENPNIEDPTARRLYQLIWRRTVASQMSDQIVDNLILKILVCKTKDYFISRMSVTKFPGWKILFTYQNDESDNNNNTSDEEKKNVIDALIGKLKKNDIFKYVTISAEEKCTLPKPRYTEGDLTKKLEKLEIGRPSTYASMVSKVLDREYAIKDTRKGESKKTVNFLLEKKELTKNKGSFTTPTEKNKIFPTPLGEKVNTFLMDKFESVINYRFTADMEKSLDKVSEGKSRWYSEVDNYYQIFHPIVENTSKTIKETGGLGKRKLKDGIYVAHGPHGPYCQVGENDDPDKRYISLPKTCDLDSITWKEIKAIPSYPKSLGKIDGEEVSLNKGKFGFYLKLGDSNVNIKSDSFGKEFNPANITLEQAKQCLGARSKSICKTKSGHDVMSGPYGWYIRYGKNFVSLPPDYQDDAKKAKTITEDDIKEFLEKKKKNFGGKKFFGGSSGRNNESNRSNGGKKNGDSGFKKNGNSGFKKNSGNASKVNKKDNGFSNVSIFSK